MSETDIININGFEVTTAELIQWMDTVAGGMKAFVDAFRSSTRRGGVRTASRLLAIKRPDVFLCVSNPNLVAAAQDIGFSRTSLNLENYWERVVEPIKASAWYNSPRPRAREAGEIWDGRAAMLDALYYQPLL